MTIMGDICRKYHVRLDHESMTDSIRSWSTNTLIDFSSRSYFAWRIVCILLYPKLSVSFLRLTRHSTRRILEAQLTGIGSDYLSEEVDPSVTLALSSQTPCQSREQNNMTAYGA
jgi:hypothetical protein